MQLAMGSIQSVLLCLFIQRDSPGSPGTRYTRGTLGFLGSNAVSTHFLPRRPTLTSATRVSLCKAITPTPFSCHVTRSATIGIPHGEFNTSKVEGTLDSEVNSIIKLFRCTNRSHSVTLAYLSILV